MNIDYAIPLFEHYWLVSAFFFGMTEDELEGGGRLSEVLDCARRDWSELSNFSFFVFLEVSEPLSQFLSLVDVDYRNVVLMAEGFDQDFVFVFFSVVGQDAELGFFSIQSLDDFVESVNESVVNTRFLNHFWQFGVNRFLLFLLLDLWSLHSKHARLTLRRRPINMLTQYQPFLLKTFCKFHKLFYFLFEKLLFI